MRVKQEKYLIEKKQSLYALKNSRSYEIILVAGRGHENYQDLGKKEIFLR